VRDRDEQDTNNVRNKNERQVQRKSRKMKGETSVRDSRKWTAQ
jgi:hypothetical protein